MKKPKDNTTRFTLRVPRDIKSALTNKARVEGRSINAQAIVLIQEGLKQLAA